MREIKFRFWTGKSMVYTEEINLNYAVKSHNLGEAPGLMQFTGLRDKNGKEIYEGDIAINLIKEDVLLDDKHTRTGTIEYSEGRFVLAYPDGDICEELFYFHQEAYSTIEVIGNIWENPELLGKRAEGK